MPEIPDKCEFDVEATGVDLNTTTNGDTIEIEVNLSREAAAALAFLVNTDNLLTVKIELKT